MSDMEGRHDMDQAARYVLQTLEETGQPMKFSELVGSYWADQVAAPAYGHPARLSEDTRGTAVSDDLSYARREIEGAVKDLADLDRVGIERITLRGDDILGDETYVTLVSEEDPDTIADELAAEDTHLVSSATPLPPAPEQPLSEEEIMGDQLSSQIYDEERTRKRRRREEANRNVPTLNPEE